VELVGVHLDRAVLRFIETISADRVVLRAFTYVATLSQSGRVIGLFQARGLDPMFENVECEAAMLPAVRGTGLFVECAHLVAGFIFGTLNTHRLESRVLLESGRANGALRKLGAFQEGVLRRAVRRDGRSFDQVLWSLLQSDWRARRPGPDSQVHRP
jgi:RimJ/RimL family protein N-acetyltransferase